LGGEAWAYVSLAYRFADLNPLEDVLIAPHIARLAVCERLVAKCLDVLLKGK